MSDIERLRAVGEAERVLTEREVSDIRAVRAVGSSRELVSLVERIVASRLDRLQAAEQAVERVRALMRDLAPVIRRRDRSQHWCAENCATCALAKVFDRLRAALDGPQTAEPVAFVATTHVCTTCASRPQTAGAGEVAE